MNSQKSENQFIFVKRLVLTGCFVSLVACGGGSGTGIGGSNQAPDPTVAEKAIAYVKRPTPNNNGQPISGDVSDPEAFNPGAHLIVKRTASLSAPEIDITNAIIGDTGDVRDPAFSDDGTKLLFALHLEDDNMDPPETWDIYEYDITQPLSATNPHRVIQDPDIASSGNDIHPQFLPGNRIIFTSTRGARTRAIQVDEGNQQFAPTVEEANTQKHAFNLHSMATDGTDIKQITFNMSDDLYPTIIRGISGQLGRIMYTRWEHSPGHNQMSLYSVNPDGTKVELLYGTNSHNTGSNNSTIEFIQPRENSSGTVMVLARPFTGTFDGGDPVMINVGQYVENTTPTTTNAGMSGPAQASASMNTVLTSPGISLAGRYSSVFPLQDGTNRAFVSYSLCYVNVVVDTTTMATETHACSDTSINLSDPNVSEAPPRYGIFVLDIGSNTVIPITPPVADTYYTDVAAALDLSPASSIPDSFDASTTPTGILDIRSVYDMDGSFDPMGSIATSIAQLADPAQATGDIVDNPTLIERPARFLRIVKGVYLPDNDVYNFKGSAFGVGNGGQLMREIIGYTPIDPDGSVRVTVPADVPLSINILDKNGRRISNRHGFWLTVRPGETLTCNGCHSPNSTLPHGRPDAEPPSIYAGASGDGISFPNTVDTFLVSAGQTMAEVRTASNPIDLKPSVDIVFTDVWTDTTKPANIAVNRVLDAPIVYSYNSLNTAKPVNRSACLNAWSELCRIIINYESDIHPIWSWTPRLDAVGDDKTCISCHNTANQANAGYLDLSDTAVSANADWFGAYSQLLQAHDEIDAAGNPVTIPGPPDANGNPTTINVQTTPSLQAGSSAQSSFFNKFKLAADGTCSAGATHCTNGQPWLSEHELKLLSEWIDIGAQYYNNPFAAPMN